ncbi:hypothetical protein B0H14DRAFT_3444631 [Mycena olivaceomarginata]|nr:hypothetical protein B0H14DRAFT_3444631 [Mycena olivaceomarginata]
MAPSISAHTYCLFFRPLARRAHKSLDAPEKSLDVVHSNDETRRSMIEIINSTWDIGIALGMESLPSLIAPNSSVYRTDHNLATIRHAKQTPILFLWMKTVEIMGTNNPNHARYAVGFSIPSEEPFHVADLAFMLQRFQDFHIRDCDYRRFELISLSYHIAPDGTHGLLLYDKSSVMPTKKQSIAHARTPPGTNRYNMATPFRRGLPILTLQLLLSLTSLLYLPTSPSDSKLCLFFVLFFDSFAAPFVSIAAKTF